MDSPQPRLSAKGLSKRFPGVHALDNVSVDLYPGEVLAVIGENGAGKSTLMKILAGVQAPDSGTLELDGAPVTFRNVRDALARGVALIHQELNLADNLDVASNIFLGRETVRWGLVDRAAMESAAKVLLDGVGLACSPSTLVKHLSLGQQQMVEIAKALSIDARILIFDEPTSSLSQGETERLYEVIRELRERGVSIVYISHRLGEVRELADRVVVLRDGVYAGALERGELEHDRMVSLMVGREMVRARTRVPQERGEPALAIDGLRTPAYPKEAVSLTVHRGEILGIAGLVGAGRTELLETVFGVTPAVDGAIAIEGQPVSIRSPRDGVAAGLALVPEDRKRSGVILEMAIRQNINLVRLCHDRKKGFVDAKAERDTAAEMMERLAIKTPNDSVLAGLLSGGNQQKVVLGKWLAVKPRILILDEPTRGIDVGAKGEIYRLMEGLAESGVAIVFVSSELEEILTMSDRALVMRDGAIVGELAHEDLSEEAVMRLATGGHRAAAEITVS